MTTPAAEIPGYIAGTWDIDPVPGALAFPGQQGQPLRRSNFNKMSAWPYAVKSIVGLLLV